MPTNEASYNTPKKPDPDAKFLTIQEAAHELGVSVKTVRRRINQDGYPHSRTAPGGPIRISREDLDYYYEAHRVHATPIRRPRRSTSRPAKTAA